MNDPHYPDHSPEIRRIRRIIGQLEGVQKMIESRRYCIEILNQTKAIGSAVQSLEAVILEKHLAHCIQAALSSENQADQEAKIAELVDLFKKRMR